MSYGLTLRILSIFLPGLMAVFSPVQAAEVIKLRADVWCPYNCDPKSDKPGYMIELAQIILGRAGYQLDYALLPWTRTIMETEQGSIDGAVGGAAEDVKGGVVGKEELGRTSNVLALPESRAFEFKDVASLATLRVGTVVDYKYDAGGPLDTYLAEQAAAKDGRVEPISGDDTAARNLMKMSAGRIDGFIDDLYVITYAASINGSAPKVKTIPLTSESSVYIIFSGKNPKSATYAKLMDDGIVELRKSGELAKILAKYQVKDWK